MTDLKPCPFCGASGLGDDGLYVTSDLYAPIVACANGSCGAAATQGDTQQEAVEKWNTRPIEDRLIRERDEALAEVARLRGEKGE